MATQNECGISTSIATFAPASPDLSKTLCSRGNLRVGSFSQEEQPVVHGHYLPVFPFSKRVIYA
jgi:hypothetical protein